MSSRLRDPEQPELYDTDGPTACDMYGEYPCETCGERFWASPDASGTPSITVCTKCSEQYEGVVRQYIQSVLHECRIREADVSDGTRVEWGSEKHVEDLKNRISGLEMWRDKSRKGSEQRANYSRVVARLKAELKSAQRAAQKKASEK